MTTTTCNESRSLVDELEGAIASGNARHRLTMFQRVSDLFMAGSRTYSDQQLALFDDVLMRLSAEIEVKVRAKLARALASTEKGLPKLIRSFAFDDAIEVAGPVLRQSPQLSDDDLIENASTKSQEHLLAIAQRIQLSELVTEVLVDRGDRRVLRTLAGNAGARFSLAGYEKLTVRAQTEHALALAILRRSDFPRQFFLKLIENASASVRAKLEAAVPAASAAIGAAVHDVASEIREDTRKTSRPHENAVRDAKMRFRARPITEGNVHLPAVSQRFEQTVVALARLGRFPVDLVERALIDEGADMVLILAKAAGCSWTTAKSLLHMHAAKRTLSPDDLDRAFAKFERLSPKTAKLAVAFHERRAKLRAGKLQRGGKGPSKADATARSAAPGARRRAPAKASAEEPGLDSSPVELVG